MTSVWSGMSVYYRGAVIAAALGLAATGVWHVLTLLGTPVSRTFWVPLNVAMFPLWLAAIISIMPLRERIAADRWRMWKIVLDGAPTWMCLLALYVGIYAALNWVLATGMVFGRITDKDPSFPRAGSGMLMIFYASGMAMLYAAGARDQAVECPEGHFVFPGQDVCSECGQRPQNKFLSMRQ